MILVVAYVDMLKEAGHSFRAEISRSIKLQSVFPSAGDTAGEIQTVTSGIRHPLPTTSVPHTATIGNKRMSC